MRARVRQKEVPVADEDDDEKARLFAKFDQLGYKRLKHIYEDNRSFEQHGRYYAQQWLIKEAAARRARADEDRRSLRWWQRYGAVIGALGLLLGVASFGWNIWHPHCTAALGSERPASHAAVKNGA
jgi:hypothetical protein